MEQHNWFASVRTITEALVHIRGVSPGADENMVSREILRQLQMDGLQQAYTESGFDPIPSDRFARQNVYAFLRGTGTQTIILLGHFDTVDTQDYGTLQPYALQPAILAHHTQELLPAGQALTDASDWMFGRGAVDMKSGVAVNIALLRHFARLSATDPLPLSLLLIATPDEENESAGMLQAVHLLTRLRDQHHLHYLGVLNTDYVTALYPGDPHKYVYSGAMGKLLPSYFCVGAEAHVGEPFLGLDVNLLTAELIRDVSMNVDLCDHSLGQVTAPPVTLHATDLKTHYDVQLPLTAYFYLNVLTLTTTPTELLDRLRTRAQNTMQQLLHRIDVTEQRWRNLSSNPTGANEPHVARTGQVLTYNELYAQVAHKLGQLETAQSLTEEWSHLPETLDARQKSVALVAHIWKLSGRQGPAIVLFYSPPYYPTVSPIDGPLQQAITAVIAAHPEANLLQLPYFPYLSDISYTSLDASIDIDWLRANMPAWQPEHTPRLPASHPTPPHSAPQMPGAYRIPLQEIQRLHLPAFNWGTYGFGAHSRSERVQMSYTFQTLPQLLYETIIQASQPL